MTAENRGVCVSMTASVGYIKDHSLLLACSIFPRDQRLNERSTSTSPASRRSQVLYVLRKAQQLTYTVCGGGRIYARRRATRRPRGPATNTETPEHLVSPRMSELTVRICTGAAHSRRRRISADMRLICMGRHGRRRSYLD